MRIPTYVWSDVVARVLFFLGYDPDNGTIILQLRGQGVGVSMDEAWPHASVTTNRIIGFLTRLSNGPTMCAMTWQAAN